MNDILIRVDRASPVPIYHQLAEGIRYRIATGQLPPGRRLPSLAAGSAAWSVNLHTVRRAYAELADAGLVETRRPGGTRVAASGLPRPTAERQTALHRFVWRLVREGGQRFDLTAEDLAGAILTAATPRRSNVVTVVECSEGQAADYARQITERWKVVAEPWSLGWAGEPPPGPILTTYFHYNEVRGAWPERGRDFVFLTARPDDHLRRALESRAVEDRLLDVVLCETEESRAHQVAADLTSLFPSPPFRIESREIAHPEHLLHDETAERNVVFPSRLWSALPANERASAGAHLLRYVFEAADLDAVGRALGWRAVHRPTVTVGQG